mmetsp:Transcript_3131/g.7948  ORF Transcript_3131/g.7948 Transcript_3131/m.7948 type:complete len:203 (-) Transcript_3131:21-629(-)
MRAGSTRREGNARPEAGGRRALHVELVHGKLSLAGDIDNAQLELVAVALELRGALEVLALDSGGELGVDCGELGRVGHGDRCGGVAEAGARLGAANETHAAELDEELGGDELQGLDEAAGLGRTQAHATIAHDVGGEVALAGLLDAANLGLAVAQGRADGPNSHAIAAQVDEPCGLHLVGVLHVDLRHFASGPMQLFGKLPL